ncbi:MAG: FAD-dependent oxidoreductase, partial [Gammaproteobacteria bacterium]|nr:FAD-dependent oxidoreductase [Gammaproteobacteria bacterium]NIR83887.1 FAD-dependent oxidoreductase [Gammaproteobacteria bacterium]NIR90666.1 FAD-dependent oxidoreductase [Gammaproteobacteria bacterium]NIV76055.1 NAD(P)-binding protein [Gammaproteobacteria bacterium]
SGLAAARALAAGGARVVVLEARERVRGRVHTLDVGGTPIDLGAAWVHGDRGNPLTDLCREVLRIRAGGGFGDGPGCAGRARRSGALRGGGYGEPALRHPARRSIERPARGPANPGPRFLRNAVNPRTDYRYHSYSSGETWALKRSISLRLVAQ